MYEGSCLCGSVRYRFNSEPVKVSHCHCRMCQKQHGAAFATYARVAVEDLVYTQGADKLVAYASSPTVRRKFCGSCGSSLEWNAGDALPGWTSVALATLDTPFQPASIVEVCGESRVPWLGSS